jgi:hypothetical protein
MMIGTTQTQRRTGRWSRSTGRHQPSAVTATTMNNTETPKGTRSARQMISTLVNLA